MKIPVDKNLPFSLSRLGFSKISSPEDLKTLYDSLKTLSLSSCVLNVKPYTVLARNATHLALLVESDSDHLFGFSATHGETVGGLSSLPFVHVQKAVQKDLIINSLSPKYVSKPSYLSSGIFNRKSILPYESYTISKNMGLDNEFEYKKVFNLSLNHLRFSVIDNIVNHKINHILLNRGPWVTKKIVLGSNIREYIGDQVFDNLFPEVFNDAIIYEDSFVKEGLDVYQKINNGDYLWNLSIQGSEGLISYDADFNVLSNIIGGVS